MTLCDFLSISALILSTIKKFLKVTTLFFDAAYRISRSIEDIDIIDEIDRMDDIDEIKG